MRKLTLRVFCRLLEPGDERAAVIVRKGSLMMEGGTATSDDDEESVTKDSQNLRSVGWEPKPVGIDEERRSRKRDAARCQPSRLMILSEVVRWIMDKGEEDEKESQISRLFD